MLAGPPLAIVVLGGKHDLADNFERLAAREGRVPAGRG
jgi:hypothetical protein